MLKFHRLGAFYMAFGGCFLLEWFGRGAQFVKYIYLINKSQTDTFQDKDNSYISA
jgi:lipoprotein